ncbi:hypothetical protein [Tahibacter amnicola]|uniref:Uncharacterized protein n=1 Tax=Tahibacter amnicola TaxID=2976241 RepID=A0ABY6BK09_9GAMM|nr:hypothetical protein [Tahibacter amnicola]UXI70353.1 hypothetical protein N4264_12180 [Tahibacter amnicola]
MDPYLPPLCERSKLAWRLVSFFSLPGEAQRVLCGSTGSYFCRESAYRNPGANYLFGCVVVAGQYVHALSGVFHDADGAIGAFMAKLKALPPREDAGVWSYAALEAAAEWEEVRIEARYLLRELGLPCNPPRRPFVIEELIEVEGYRPFCKDWGRRV